MSVVAYRGGIMASDSLAWQGRGQPGNATKSNKVRRIHSGIFKGGLVGIVSGYVGAPSFLYEKICVMETDCVPKSFLDDDSIEFAMLVATVGGSLILYDGKLYPQYLEAPFCAIGSGGNYASGAMQMGATALEAVNAAIVLDPCCGGFSIAHELRK